MNEPTDPLADHRAGIEYLRNQLTAESAKVRKLGEQYKSEIHLRIDREQQMQTLVAALKEISGNDCKYCDCQENSKQIADEALEKYQKSIKI